MTFYSIIEPISHLWKMARTSAKSENPDDIMQRFTYNEKNGDDLLQYNESISHLGKMARTSAKSKNPSMIYRIF